MGRPRLAVSKLPLALCVAALAALAPAQAQTLARYAPADALFALELSDLAGAQRTANAFVQRFQASDLLGTLFGAADIAPEDLRVLEGFAGLLDREGLVALYVSPTTGEPRVLLAAKPATNADARMRALVQQRLSEARASNNRVQSYRAGGLPVYTVASGGETFAFGYQSGLAYAGTDLRTVSGFLRRAAGASEPALGTSSGYRAAMGGVGPGTLRLYADLKGAAGLLGPVAREAGEDLGGIRPAPFLNALATLGRVGVSYRVTATGLETATLLTPSPNSGDPALAALLASTARPSLRAASVVPGNAVSFSTSDFDFGAFYRYLSGLVDRSGLNPGGLDPLISSTLGVDLRRSVLPWLGREFASVSFPPLAGSGVPSGLGDSVVYLAVTDEAAARAGVAAVVPRLADVASSLGALGMGMDMGGGTATGTGTGTATGTASGTVTIQGTAVTRYPLGDGTTLSTAVRNGFLILSTSETGMRQALAPGVRLADSAGYRTALTRVPAWATAYGYTQAGRSLRTTGSLLSSVLSPLLTLGADVRPSDATRLATRLSNLIEFTAARVGTQVSWTQSTPAGVLSRSFLPVRW